MSFDINCIWLNQKHVWLARQTSPFLHCFWLISVVVALLCYVYAKCHRGGKNRGPTGTRTQGLSLTVRALCQLSYRATWSSFDIFPLLNKIRPPNLLGTTEERDVHLFDARCPSREPTLSHQMSQGRKKSWPDRDSNPGPLAIRETTELLSQWSSFDINI